MESAQTQLILETIGETEGKLVAKSDLVQLRADLYRALWIQSAGIGAFTATPMALKLL